MFEQTCQLQFSRFTNKDSRRTTTGRIAIARNSVEGWGVELGGVGTSAGSGRGRGGVGGRGTIDAVRYPSGGNARTIAEGMYDRPPLA